MTRGKLLLLLRIGEARAGAHTIFAGGHLHRSDGLHNGAPGQADGAGDVGAAAACADADIVIALLQHEGGGALTENGHFRYREAERQQLPFARVERARFLEAVKAADRAGAFGIRVGVIDLNDLLHRIFFAGVENLCGHDHVAAVKAHRDGDKLRLAVAEAVAEGVENGTVEGIKPAVAVEAVKRLRGLVELGQRFRPAVRQTAGGHDQDVFLHGKYTMPQAPDSPFSSPWNAACPHTR